MSWTAELHTLPSGPERGCADGEVPRSQMPEAPTSLGNPPGARTLMARGLFDESAALAGCGVTPVEAARASLSILADGRELTLPGDLFANLESYAAQHGISITLATRCLIAAGLAAEAADLAEMRRADALRTVQAWAPSQGSAEA